MKNALLRPIKNERGIMTLDFIFAFVLVMGFSFLFFSLSLTLTVVEITQYITFASARTAYGGHLNPDLQVTAAQNKFAELTKHQVFEPLYKNGWFEIANPPLVGHASQMIQGYKQSNPNQDRFYGVATQFTARMLDFNIPFYGSTAPEGDGEGSGFTTVIGSYIGREVSAVECTAFVSGRWAAIRRLAVKGASPYTTSTSDGGYVLLADNGC